MPVDDELIDRMLSGEPSDEEATAFEQWLKNPANLQRFALRAELHSDLRQSLRRRQIQTNALGASNAASEIIPGLTKQNHQQSLIRSPKRVLAIAAGLVTAACLLIAFIRPHRDDQSTSEDRVAASVVRNVGGLFTKGDQQ